MRLTLVLTLALLFGGFVSGQTGKNAQPKSNPLPAIDNLAQVRSSPAFAEVLLRRTEYEAEIESLILEYTDEFPKVKELRQGILLLNKESVRLFATKAGDVSKLTLALGKLIVRKVEVEIDLWKLQQSYADGHPDVKRAKKKVEIYEKAIKEILG